MHSNNRWNKTYSKSKHNQKQLKALTRLVDSNNNLYKSELEKISLILTNENFLIIFLKENPKIFFICLIDSDLFTDIEIKNKQQNDKTNNNNNQYKNQYCDRLSNFINFNFLDSSNDYFKIIENINNNINFDSEFNSQNSIINMSFLKYDQNYGYTCEIYEYKNDSCK